MHSYVHTYTHIHSQAFSSRVFYNADTGFFEQVLGEGLLGWMEGGVVSSSSQASLYLADELVGQVRERESE